MPENYYCLDNFFQKLTAMESPRRNNDCYFYYYSTCTKGDSCTFRHEPSALGCETTCSFWKEGKCFNVQCNFRHMELRKNRKVIPCYWETQPGGCLKPHCPFLHQNPKHLSHSECQGEASDIKSQELNKQSAIQKTDSCAKNASQTNEKSFGNPVVDPLVVNFEEESDNESAPTQSPIKTSRTVKVKTLEEIRLEKVQAESAAYYSYPETVIPENSDDLRERIVRRINMKQDEKRKDFNILSLKEIRRKRKLPFDMNNEDITGLVKRQNLALNKPKKDISEVKVKTLEEIRAERAQRATGEYVMVSSSNEIRQFGDISANTQSSEESEVSSTSRPEERRNTTNTEEKDEEKVHVAKVQPIKRLKRSRSGDSIHKQEKIMKLDDENIDKNGDIEIKDKEDSCDKLISTDVVIESEVDIKISNESPRQDRSQQSNDATLVLHDKSILSDSKLDEVLLLDEEDLDEPDIIKAEEDILKNIDDLLND